VNKFPTITQNQDLGGLFYSDVLVNTCTSCEEAEGCDVNSMQSSSSSLCFVYIREEFSNFASNVL
jgi:hypothetical protein